MFGESSNIGSNVQNYGLRNEWLSLYKNISYHYMQNESNCAKQTWIFSQSL